MVPKGALVRAEIAAADRNSKLLREWIEASLPTFCYFSCCIPQLGGTSRLLVGQVVSPPRKVITIPTYNTNEVHQRSCWGILLLDIRRRDELLTDPTSLEVFSVEETTQIDLVDMLDANPEARRTFQTWVRQLPDVSGGFILCSPTRAQPRSDFSDKNHPILSLLDALESCEHMAIDRKLEHSIDSGLFWDKKSEHLRPYLQCVLCADWLRKQGQLTFESRLPVSYYQMVLRKPGSVEPGLTGKSYMKMLAGVDPDAVEKPESIVSVQPPRKRLRAEARDPDVDADSDDGPQPAIKDCDVDASSSDSVPSAKGSSSSTSSSGSSSSNSSVDASSDGDNSLNDFPKQLQGRPLRRERHKEKGDEGVRVSCPTHGARCRKFRSLAANVNKFGLDGPLYFLGAWQNGGRHMPMQEHRKWKPSVANIRAYITSNG